MGLPCAGSGHFLTVSVSLPGSAALVSDLSTTNLKRKGSGQGRWGVEDRGSHSQLSSPRITREIRTTRFSNGYFVLISTHNSTVWFWRGWNYWLFIVRDFHEKNIIEKKSVRFDGSLTKNKTDACNFALHWMYNDLWGCWGYYWLGWQVWSDHRRHFTLISRLLCSAITPQLKICQEAGALSDQDRTVHVPNVSSSSEPGPSRAVRPHLQAPRTTGKGWEMGADNDQGTDQCSSYFTK